MPRQEDTGAPGYEGRPLPRPDDELVDQGLAFDVGTLMSRRRILGVFGLGAATVGLAACGAGATTTSATTGTGSGSATAAGSLPEIPDETAGPYPGDGSNGVDVLSASGVVRSDIRSSFGSSTTTADGVPLRIELTVLDSAKGMAPMEGAAVYLWHCDAAAGYSLYDRAVADENYLRGVQPAAADGRLAFTTVFPGAYSGRWPHVHFQVFRDVTAATSATGRLRTSQLALPRDASEAVYADGRYPSSARNLSRSSLDTDLVFRDGYALQLARVTGSNDSGYTASLVVPV